MRGRSVGALVTLITGLLALMLVLMFFLAAMAAMERQRLASNDLAAVHEASSLLAAKQAVRIEAGFLGAALEAPLPATAQDRAHLLSLHKAAAPLLAAIRLSDGPLSSKSSATRSGSAGWIMRRAPPACMRISAPRPGG